MSDSDDAVDYGSSSDESDQVPSESTDSEAPSSSRIVHFGA